MLFLISPAKSLDFESPIPRVKATEPLYLDQSTELIGALRRQSAPQISALMELSPQLAELNVARYKAWKTPFTARNARPAVFAFDGDVYGGLEARTLQAPDIRWAQSHLCILSGLHGVLRPLDRIQPYRLEMSIRLANARGENLYQFWGEQVSEYLNTRTADERSPVVVNLASQEYFQVVQRKALRARVVECVFEEERNGAYKIISFSAKRARGLMARFAIRERAASVRKLQAFDAEGYRYTPAASTPERLVFRRPQPEAAT